MSLAEATFFNFLQHLYDVWIEEGEKRGYTCDFPNLGHTNFHLLCEDPKNLKALRQLLAVYEGSVDLVDPDSGVTPLVTACKCGNLEAVKMLVKHGANVNHPCSGVTRNGMKYGNVTPIYIAAEGGHVSIVEFLGHHGADVNIQMSPLGFTPLHRAMFQRHKHVVSVLIKKFKAKVSIPCIETPGAYPIYNAIIVDDMEVLELILEAEDVDPNIRDPTENITALHLAAYKGDLQAAEILISHGADVNAQLKSGHSPLDLAIQEKSRHLVEYLKQHGGRRKILDKSWHPFLFCVANGVQSMKAAINKGADVNSMLTPKAGTALHVSVHRRRMDACKFLIRKGADLERTDVFGKTPLHIATELGLLKFMEFLLEKGANINAQTTAGFTPLHRAAMLGNYIACKLLIDRGADIELMAPMFGPPLIAAVHQSRTNVVKLLLDSGANPNAKNPEGSYERVTVLQIAVQYAPNKPEIFKALIEAGVDVKAPITARHGTLSYLHVLPIVSDKVESLKLMIEAGAFIDSIATQTDFSPFSRFCLHVNRGDHGDNCKPLRYSGTPLQTVKKSGRPELVQLLENTVNLFKAVRKDDLALAEKYFAQGGLVNCCSVRYDTPLIYCSWKGFTKMVKFLLAKGAKMTMPNVQNSSPLHYAARYNQKEVAIELLKAGALINLVRCDKTPLQLAQEHNQCDVLAILEFTNKYLIESRTNKISPNPEWKSDPKINKLASTFDGKVTNKDLEALFEP